MTPEEESERIRALLREAHRGDEPSCPPFRRLAGNASGQPAHPRWHVRAVAVAAMAAAVAVVAVVAFRRDRSSPVRFPVALASPALAAEGPLDFLLELPKPAPLDPLASLRRPLPSRSDPNRRR